MSNKILETTATVGKVIGSLIVSAAIVEMGYHGGRMLQSDVEVTADVINSKINPTIMKKRHWYSKPEKYNTRTKKFVADKKNNKKSK